MITFTIKKDKKKRFYFIATAQNGKSIARSSETYSRRTGVLGAINSLITNISDGKSQIIDTTKTA